MQKPVIGVTRCGRLDDYLASVERAGGRARVLEVSESPRKVVGEIDGLLLTGGGDIDPALYREERHETVEDAEPGRDEFEIDIARRAMDADIPLLAICRGAQVLNVAAGGTLVQDIPSEPGLLEHTIKQPKDHIAHDVTVAPGSKLEAALGQAITAAHTCRVNSRHHQSVGRLGAPLIATAKSTDGVVEAVEKADVDFCIGVQWHPENFWRTGEFNGLFAAFVSAALRRNADRTRPATPREEY